MDPDLPMIAVARATYSEQISAIIGKSGSLISAIEYAKYDATKQAERVSNSKHKRFPSVKFARFC